MGLGLGGPRTAERSIMTFTICYEPGQAGLGARWARPRHEPRNALLVATEPFGFDGGTGAAGHGRSAGAGYSVGTSSAEPRISVAEHALETTYSIELPNGQWPVTGGSPRRSRAATSMRTPRSRVFGPEKIAAARPTPYGSFGKIKLAAPPRRWSTVDRMPRAGKGRAAECSTWPARCTPPYRAPAPAVAWAATTR